MKNKIPAIIVIAVVIILIIVAIVLLVNKNEEKVVAKEFAEIVTDEAKLKEFFENKLNYRYAYAYDNIEHRDADEKELKAEFERIAKEISNKDLESFKAETVENNVSLYTLSGIKKMKFKNISEEKKITDLPIVTYKLATYEITKDDETQTEEDTIAFVYYNNDLFLVIPGEYLAMDAYIDEADIGEPEEEAEEAKEVGDLELSEEEINSFNQNFADMDQVIVDGAELKELIDNVIAINNQYAGDGKRFVSIDNNYIESYEGEGLFTYCISANPYFGGDNTKENVDLANGAIEELKKAIDDNKSYEVELEFGRGIVVEVSVGDAE